MGYVVSRLLAGNQGAAGDLDDITTYYLLHRSDFGLGPAPAGACILYALSCNLSDAELAGRHGLLVRGRKTAADADEEDPHTGTVSGSDARLNTWQQRRQKNLGRTASDGTSPPLIDCLHRVMQLWKTGEQGRVDGYLDERALWKNEVFASVVQAVLEMAKPGSGERELLESVQNHLRGGGVVVGSQTVVFCRTVRSFIEMETVIVMMSCGVDIERSRSCDGQHPPSSNSTVPARSLVVSCSAESSRCRAGASL